MSISKNIAEIAADLKTLENWLRPFSELADSEEFTNLLEQQDTVLVKSFNKELTMGDIVRLKWAADVLKGIQAKL